MPEDRLKKDFDYVENLSDLIKAREERRSAFSEDVDAMEDIEEEGLAEDPNRELTFPHPHTQSDEYGKEGINAELMSTHHQKEIEFDWQDSAEEMLQTDPDPNEGMGEDSSINRAGGIDATEMYGIEPTEEPSSGVDTSVSPNEVLDYELDGGEPEKPLANPVQIEGAMETDSDEDDLSIEDRFGGQVNHETALYQFEEIDEEIESDSGGERKAS